jgi:TolB-like protein
VKFWAELQRRHVIRIVLAYLVAAWLLVQVAVSVEAPLGLPGWFDTFIIVLAGIGFPIVAVLAWAFDITAEGIKRTPAAEAGTQLPEVVAASAAPAPAAVAAPPPAPPASNARSIAVLPFADMSPEHDQEYFSDGLSEELLNVLAQIPELRVAGRTSSFSFKGRHEDLRIIGERLGVANVLEGSVRKAGERLRITAQLVSAADGYHLWSQTYDRTLDDVFAIQDEIARAVADALSVTLGLRAASAATGLTEDSDVYDRYLRARALFNSQQPADLLRATEVYRRIIDSDPGFTRARAGLAEACYYLAIYIPERAAEAIRIMEAAVADALAHAPDEWTTHFASAVLHEQRLAWADAERAYARAAESAPASDLGMIELRVWMLEHRGRMSEAVDLLQATMALDPLSVGRSYLLQSALLAVGRAEDAEAEYQRSLDLPGQREAIEHTALIRVWNGGDAALIRARWDRFISYEVVPIPAFAAVRDAADDAEAALAILRAAAADPANQDSLRLLLIGFYAAHFGDSAFAVDLLRRATVELGTWGTNVWWWPDLADTRRTAGFKALVREIGLADYWRASGHWGDFARPVGEDDFECF